VSSICNRPAATNAEEQKFIERRAPMRRGYCDVHLRANGRPGTLGQQWSRDRRRGAVAAELDLTFAEPG
jgi:hypothetical protein